MKIKNTDKGRGVWTPEIEELGKSYFGNDFDKIDFRLLPYVWNRVNETDGVLETKRMNLDEIKTINAWALKGFLKITDSYEDEEAEFIFEDKSTLSIKVEKEFYDKMVNLLIVGNYISEHNHKEI